MFGADWRGIIWSIGMNCSKDEPIKFRINGYEIPTRFSDKVFALDTIIQKHLKEIDKAQAKLIKFAMEEK